VRPGRDVAGSQNGKRRRDSNHHPRRAAVRVRREVVLKWRRPPELTGGSLRNTDAEAHRRHANGRRDRKDPIQ
jgi:hypothetical protein